LVHLELVLEIGDRTEALDDRRRPVLAGEVDEQRREDLCLDVRHVDRGPLDEAGALLAGEQRLLLAERLIDDPDHDLVEDPRSPADDVEVAVGDRVVAPRADRDPLAHRATPWILIAVWP